MQGAKTKQSPTAFGSVSGRPTPETVLRPRRRAVLLCFSSAPSYGTIYQLDQNPVNDRCWQAFCSDQIPCPPCALDEEPGSHADELRKREDCILCYSSARRAISTDTAKRQNNRQWALPVTDRKDGPFRLPTPRQAFSFPLIVERAVAGTTYRLGQNTDDDR